jgi:hypothetical protein
MEQQMEKEKVLTSTDPEFLPVQFDLTEAKVNQLAEDYDPKTIPKALEVGDENYTFIHNKVMAITKIRTGADKVRVKLKADSLAWGRKVDAYAGGLREKLEALEAPWRKVKLDLEEAERKAAEERAAAERKRQDEIETNIAGIRILAEGLIGASSADIQKNIDILDKLVIGETNFGEYVEAAQVTGDIVRKSLVMALEERTAFEMGLVAFEREKAAMAEKKTEMDAQQEALDKQKAAQEASEKAVEDAKKAEDDRKAEVKAAAQRSSDAAQASKKQVAYLKKRLPQDKELVTWATTMALVELPELKDEHLVLVLKQAHRRLAELVEYVYLNTQGGE